MKVSVNGFVFTGMIGAALASKSGVDTDVGSTYCVEKVSISFSAHSHTSRTLTRGGIRSKILRRSPGSPNYNNRDRRSTSFEASRKCTMKYIDYTSQTESQTTMALRMANGGDDFMYAVTNDITWAMSKKFSPPSSAKLRHPVKLMLAMDQRTCYHDLLVFVPCLASNRNRKGLGSARGSIWSDCSRPSVRYTRPLVSQRRDINNSKTLRTKALAIRFN